MGPITQFPLRQVELSRSPVWRPKRSSNLMFRFFGLTRCSQATLYMHSRDRRMGQLHKFGCGSWELGDSRYVWRVWDLRRVLESCPCSPPDRARTGTSWAPPGAGPKRSGVERVLKRGEIVRVHVVQGSTYILQESTYILQECVHDPALLS